LHQLAVWQCFAEHGTSRYKKRPIRSPTVHHTSCGTWRRPITGGPNEGIWNHLNQLGTWQVWVPSGKLT
jgi:hypothetical protein